MKIRLMIRYFGHKPGVYAALYIDDTLAAVADFGTLDEVWPWANILLERRCQEAQKLQTP